MAEITGRSGEIQKTFWKKKKREPDYKLDIEAERNSSVESDTEAFELVNLLVMMGYLLNERHFGEI